MQAKDPLYSTNLSFIHGSKYPDACEKQYECASSNITYKPKEKDNGKFLRCEIIHGAYTDEDLNNQINLVAFEISIGGPPIKQTEIQTFDNLTIGK